MVLISAGIRMHETRSGLQKGIAKGEILCENSSKAQRHSLQRRTPLPTICVRDICLSTGDIEK
jgi:hypothetical protein